MNLQKLYGIVLLFSLTANSVVAQESNTQRLIIGSEQDYPPFALGKTDKEALGFTVELWKAVAKDAGLPYTIQVKPFHEILEGFKNHKIDVLINLAQSAERATFADFTIPHVTVHGAVFVRKGSTDISAETQLKDKSVIVLAGDLAHDYAVAKSWGNPLILVKTAAEGFKLLNQGQHDAMLISKLVGLQTLDTLHLDHKIVPLDVKVGFSQKFSFAVHKNNQELLNKINVSLAIVKASGLYDKIYEKWFGLYHLEGNASSQVTKYLAIIAFLASYISIVIYLKRARDKRNADLALKNSERHYETLMTAFPVGVFELDLQGQCVYVNQRWTEITGIEADAALTRVWVDLIHPEDRQRIHTEWTGCLSNALSNQMEFRYLHRTGKLVWVLGQIISSKTVTGKIQGYIGTLTDISERKDIELNLYLYRNLIEYADEPFYMMDPDDQYRMVFVNEAACRHYQVSREKLLSMHVWDWDPDFDHAKITQFWNDLRQLKHLHFETIHRVASGEIVPVEISANYLLHQNKEFIAGYFRNISKRKEVENNLLQAKEIAVRSAKVKASFLANMSHEIRTPLNGIIGLSLLAMTKEPSPVIQDYLEKILSTSESLLGILNDILDFSKIDSGRMSINQEEFNLDTLVTNLANLFSARIEQKCLTLEINIHPEIPKHLIGDELRLQQVLTNLIGNAVKFTEHGKITLSIVPIKCSTDHTVLEFSVIDTGIGIAREELARLFEPFSQADGTITRRFGGTGLGLAISHELLRLMDSDIHVESTKDVGTRFTFQLKLKIASVVSNASRIPLVTKPPRGHQHGAEQLRERKILVVEDNLINQKVVSEFLKLNGAQVSTALNGLEALEILQHQVFDAILMDVHMPIMDGIEATRKIRALPQLSTLPIIALTAGVTSDERAICLECGMNDVIAKPFNPHALIATLCRFIECHQVSAPMEVGTNERSSPQKPALDGLHGFNFTNLRILVENDERLIKELLIDFKREVLTIFPNLMSHITSGDFPTARSLTHKIKGSAGNIGAQQLYQLASLLESELIAGQYSEATLSNFHQAYNQAVSSINKVT